MITGMRTAYPDLKVVSNEEIYTENKFAGRWTFTGTNTGPGEMPPTGKSVTVWGINIIHFKDGKIVEEWDAFDNLPFIEQLGFSMMPPSEVKQ
jgi:predicted ester cyclase